MSLDFPQNDKMMHEAPEKKGWHFSGGGLYFAKYIEAETIEEATEIWEKVRQLIDSSEQISPSSAPAPDVKEADAIE